MIKQSINDIRVRLSYWRWFFRGNNSRPGYTRLVNRWAILHVVVGLGLSFLVPICLEQAASAVLLPLSGIFVGLAFAWAVNSQALLQSKEIEELAEHKEGGLADYVFTYQTAILVILVTLVLWGLSGLKVFDMRWPTPNNPNGYFIAKTILYASSSFTLRECWHVIIGTQWMLLLQEEVKKLRGTKTQHPSDGL